MTKKYVLIIALCALVLLVIPSNAYNLVSSEVLPSSGVITGDYNVMKVNNLSAFSRDITHLDYTIYGTVLNVSAQSSDSFNIELRHGAILVGNATVSYSGVTPNAGWIPIRFVWDILDLENESGGASYYDLYNYDIANRFSQFYENSSSNEITGDYGFRQGYTIPVAGEYNAFAGDFVPPTPTPTGTIPTPYPTTPVPTVAPGYTRTSFQCTNSMNTAAISGCSIQLRNLEGNVWSNKTDTDGTWYIDTLPYAHTNAYSQATGYSNGVRLNLQTWPTPTFYTILMVPGYVPPATSGYIWVYVHVLDANGDLADARVDIQGSGLTTRSDYTDSSGVVRFQWPNSSTAYINAAKAGYATSSRVITTTPLGPDIVDIELHRGTQTVTIVPTTGPGGTVPTTIDPAGTPDPSGGSSAYSNAKGQQMLDYLAAHGMDLIMICFMVTVLALLGVRLGK